MFVNKKDFKSEIDFLKEHFFKIQDKITRLEELVTSNDVLRKQVNKSFLDELRGIEHSTKVFTEERLSAFVEKEFESFKVYVEELIHSYKLEKDISDKQVELLIKIVCHLSGAKQYEGNRDFSFDEIARRLAKLESREDLKDGA